MIVLEVVFLVLFWTWVLSAGLFLRNTFLPRLPVTITPATLQLPFEGVAFHATDGLKLAGWKIPGDPARPWVILCHGLGTNRADMLDIAAGLHGTGLNLFLFDFRAHGESQGNATSFGWHEQRDLEGALVYLGQQPDVPDRPYGILGISMGGSVAIMVASGDERLGAVAIDSSYTNLERSIGLHLKLLYHLPKHPFLLFAGSAYRMRFGVWPNRMAPIDQIGRISPRPVLLIQSQDDPRIPVEDTQAMFERAKEPKELWIVPGMEHLGAYQHDPSVYINRLAGFFTSHLTP